MIKPRRHPWPFPGDTALDRARAVAREYRRVLLQFAPDRVHALDRHFTNLGEPWVAPQRADLDLNAELPAQVLSDYLGGEPTADTLRQWRARGHLPKRVDDRGRPVYRVGDVLDHVAEQRRARANRSA